MLKYTKLDGDHTEGLILDFKLFLKSIPEWISIYSPGPLQSVHRVQVTTKVMTYKANYTNAISNLLSKLSPVQYKSFV